ncbi:hypothetical protein NHX12_030078 [Muraenolepis orangiensis]|uniref:Telomeric repeat-binding factor 2-interacting protein 1 n=1 Tax=Muraenolepis orangiensis TaxID=630683 RepID=A0A9Q0IKN6_9TELE|nr:hypothetical protein NHX12_030078 [Muraenolepis orangiensis]
MLSLQWQRRRKRWWWGAEEEAPPLVPAKAPQHTSSPVRSQKNKTTTTASEPEVGASPGTPLRRSFRCPTLPHTPPSDTPSRKKARTSAPSGSPKASTSTASPSSLPPPAPPAQPASTPTAPPAHQPTESPPLAGRTPTSNGAANPATQKEAEPTGKRKEKRKLGVLEMASDEFEDGGESDYEEAPDQLETQKDTQHHPAETASMPPTATPQVATETRTAMETSQVAPKPHLFIFDNESQEECSQPMDCDEAATPVGPRPIGKKGEVVSETQAQLEEDMQRIRELVKQTNQDLVSVTKALLKTSGDFSSALALLLNPASAQGPPWSRRHDRLLLTSDPKAHRQLRKRYGEQSVARRLAFLNGE